MTVLLVIIILAFLIVIHELGHFIAAKIFGVKVEEFGVGYPPRAFLFGRIGGTEYTLNWIPFGGFVRLFGEEESTHNRGSFMDSPRWKQGVILVAGVCMNAIAAWGLFSAGLALGVPRIVDQAQPGQPAHLYVSDVIAGSPAEAAGIAAGDEILSVHDQKGMSPDSLTPDSMVAFVQARGGQPLSITLMHAGTTTSARVIPANAVVAQNAGKPALGVGLVLVAMQSLPPLEAIKEGLTVSTYNSFADVGAALWGILLSAVHGAPNLQGVVGPVGLVSAVADASRSGLGELFSLAGFISVNLVIVNLLPIPALDGGRLAVLIIESLTRRRAPKLAVQLVNTVGLALIILLMVTVTYHDVARLLA